MFLDFTINIAFTLDSVQLNNWNEHQSSVIFRRTIRLPQSCGSSELLRKVFNLMYNKLVEGGSVTTYVRRLWARSLNLLDVVVLPNFLMFCKKLPSHTRSENGDVFTPWNKRIKKWCLSCEKYEKKIIFWIMKRT